LKTVYVRSFGYVYVDQDKFWWKARVSTFGSHTIQGIFWPSERFSGSQREINFMKLCPLKA